MIPTIQNAAQIIPLQTVNRIRRSTLNARKTQKLAELKRQTELTTAMQPRDTQGAMQQRNAKKNNRLNRPLCRFPVFCLKFHKFHPSLARITASMRQGPFTPCSCTSTKRRDESGIGSKCICRCCKLHLPFSTC